jgi:hypothetical protein
LESYRSLFSLQLSHQYFANGAWGDVDFAPTEATQRIFKSCGAVLRQHGSSLSIMYDSGRRVALGMFADENGGELRIGLKASVRDRSFSNYTALGAKVAESLLCFSNDPTTSPDQGAIRLSREEVASAADCRPFRDLLAEGLLVPAEVRMAPDMLIDLRFSMDMLDSGEPARFRIGFATRNLYWNYILLGGINRDNLFIVDLDEKVEFEQQSAAYAVANRQGRVFRSSTQLPIHEKSTLRFQLRERGNGSGKIVLRRLPVAADNFGRQTIAGVEELVSNMFLNF